MVKNKQVSSTHRTSTAKKGHTAEVHNKNVYAEIYPMMPRGFTAIQRAQ